MSDTTTVYVADTAAVGKSKQAKTDLNTELESELVAHARASGLQLTGEGGLLAQLTNLLVESALDGEITDHLGYEHGAPAGRGTRHSRNGNRAKTVVTEPSTYMESAVRGRGQLPRNVPQEAGWAGS
ncbi:transposase [Nocardia nova]|uniref:transposase n=1 Tax=Nocardia nova TaxID=37330 RepID=UPI003F6A04FD